MQTDLNTLIKLLQALHQEVETCMTNRSIGGSLDPIILGDFIVDAYNSYLASAKTICDDPTIQSLANIEKLGDISDIQSKVRDPRLHKMHEVAFVTKQLLTLLEGMVRTGKAGVQSEIIGVMSVLESLDRQIAEAKMPLLVKAAQGGEGQKVDRQLVHYLVEEYNRCLTMVLEITKDPVLAKLFRPLELVNELSASESDYQKKLSELGIAQSSLLSYLKKMYERSGIAD
jgi:hypothetical protein